MKLVEGQKKIKKKEKRMAKDLSVVRWLYIYSVKIKVLPCNTCYWYYSMKESDWMGTVNNQTTG